jgi:hypothetical protein
MVLEFLNQFAHLNHQILTVIACHDSLDPFYQNLENLDSSLGCCRGKCHQ